jgi:hypothetical protein
MIHVLLLLVATYLPTTGQHNFLVPVQQVLPSPFLSARAVKEFDGHLALHIGAVPTQKQLLTTPELTCGTTTC